MAVGGPYVNISIAGREFEIPADADPKVGYGGFVNESMPNGSGSARLIKKRELATITGMVVEIDSSRGDFEFLQNVKDGSEYVDVSLAGADGGFENGALQIEGELRYSKASASTEPFDLKGGGKIKAL